PLEGRALLAAAPVAFDGPFSVPVDLLTGPDGDLWVLDQGVRGDSDLVVVTPDWSVKAVYTIPTPHAAASALAVGPDGDVWFTEPGADKVGKATPGGAVTESPIPATAVDPGSGTGPVAVAADPTDLVAGPDGAVWFTEPSAQEVGRITPDGTLTEIPTPG